MNLAFSIVIPVYNTERFLPRCLDSLVAQTDGNFEVVVVDDDSPSSKSKSKDCETCSDIVGRYDDRFRCLRHEKNRSAFQARCTGVKAAVGAYVVPVDPDDYLMPETLARLRAVIEREKPDLLSYRMEYDDGEKVWDHWCHHSSMTLTGIEALRELTAHKYFTGVASKTFRRETLLAALRELNAPDDLYVNTCDDFLMLAPMLMKSAKVTFLDYAGYRYFVNGKSTSFSWKTRAGYQRAFAQMRLANRLIIGMANNPSVSPEIRMLVAKAVAGIEDWFVQMRRDNLLLLRIAHRFLRMCSRK